MTDAMAGEPVRVLVVNHQAERRAAIRAMLPMPGVVVVEASSAEQALLHLLGEEEFAILLITVVMPGMGGLELASLVRQRPKTAHVPIVFITAVATERESILEGYALGGVDYLIEPLVPEAVHAKVAAFVDLYRARKELEEKSRALLEAQKQEREIEILELRLATERKYRSLADAIPHIVFSAKPDGTLEYLNRGWYEYTGISFAQAASTWTSALYPDDVPVFKERLAAILERGEPLETEVRIRRGKDGAYRWNIFRAVPQHGAMGEVVSWIGTFTDVDEERRSRASLAEFRATLDSVHDAVVLFEPGSMQILYANWGASLLWGSSVPELLQHRADELVAHGDVARFRSALEELTGDGPGSRTIEVRCHRIDGATVPAELLLQIVPQVENREAASRAIVIARDTSERQQAEAERELLYRNALEAVRARDEFLSIASHELKSPLTALSMQLDVLARPPKAKTEAVPQAILDKLTFAKRQVDRLTRLLNELLDISRIHAGRLSLDIEDVDLTALVREVVDRFADSAANVKSELVVSAQKPCMGRWDRLRIEQVVVNLISNALKFGGGKPIEVTVVGEDGGKLARLGVRDHGIGIAPEEVERIFSRFERAVPSRAYAGLGLGLYIVRQIVTAHGGTIRVESQPGQGATFIVELPTACATKEKDEGEAQAEERSEESPPP